WGRWSEWRRRRRRCRRARAAQARWRRGGDISWLSPFRQRARGWSPSDGGWTRGTSAARGATPVGSGTRERDVDQRDGEGAGEEQHEQAEERPAELHVAALQVRVEHQSTSGSTAAATNRSARYASE